MASTIDQHGGNRHALAKRFGVSPEEILDFSANINPLGFPDWVRSLVNARLSDLLHYPDIGYARLREAIAYALGIDGGQVVVCNGASEAIYQIPRALRRSKAFLFEPAFCEYAAASRLAGAQVISLLTKPQEGFSLPFDQLASELEGEAEGSLVWLGYPNNPTGQLFDLRTLATLARHHPQTLFLVDESFYDFCDPAQVPSTLTLGLENLIVIRSLTKILALPGLRLGYLVAHPRWVAQISEQIPPWSVGSLAMEVGIRAFSDPQFFEKTRLALHSWRPPLETALRALPGITVYAGGKANFLLFSIENEGAATLSEALMKRDLIAIRDASNFAGLSQGTYRIAVRSPKENTRLVAGIQHYLGQGAKISSMPSPKKRARALMLAGTGSDVGKSILTAALCRILYQDGVKVAPFKAQNMALNSAVTPGGREIGRAQAVQAEAAGIECDVRMNPILLKPTSERTSQVILSGKPYKNLTFSEYRQEKGKLLPLVREAYDQLAGQYDVMILEGAGGVGEVNLKDDDLVNLPMAAYAEAGVLLVGDIDRGGVFASLVGSLETMAEWERRLVKGLIINRFRGVKELLNPGITYLQERLSLPVLGVVPWFEQLRIPLRIRSC